MHLTSSEMLFCAIFKYFFILFKKYIMASSFGDSLNWFLMRVFCLSFLIINTGSDADFHDTKSHCNEDSTTDGEKTKYFDKNHSDSCVTDMRASSTQLVASLEDWHFADTQLLTESFPLDAEQENYVHQVRNAVFSIVYPVPFKTSIKLVAISHEVLKDILDLDPSITSTDFFQAFISGNTYLSDSTPLAHRYGGHQFGSWSGQLGDGRAVMLGEYVNRKGERWELQLKGSGLTPYSRRGDGRAVLRSSVREFLMSEAMHYLGVPTTRALSLVVSNDPIWRDQFYDGHPSQEKGAVVLRLARSWFRIGSLEILAMNGEKDLLRKLTDFIIEKYFDGINHLDKDRYLSFFAKVVSQTADMIVKWMSIGFAHGVMNTDNFSILSLTIDYGPFGFLDGYVPGFIPNTSDDEGRYSYDNQPDIGYFNLNKLREALLPLLDGNQQKQARQILSGYADIYKTKFMETFRKKLGLLGVEEEDEYVVAYLLQIMQNTAADFTMTFRQLGDLPLDSGDSTTIIPDTLWALKHLSKHSQFTEWLQAYRQRLQKNGDKDSDEDRRLRMKGVNPRYILRNWMAQQAIEKAEKEDFAEVQSLLQILKRPYEDQLEADKAGYASQPPHWARDVRVSCSS